MLIHSYKSKSYISKHMALVVSITYTSIFTPEVSGWPFPAKLASTECLDWTREDTFPLSVSGSAICHTDHPVWREILAKTDRKRRAVFSLLDLFH